MAVTVSARGASAPRQRAALPLDSSSQRLRQFSEHRRCKHQDDRFQIAEACEKNDGSDRRQMTERRVESQREPEKWDADDAEDERPGGDT